MSNFLNEDIIDIKRKITVGDRELHYDANIFILFKPIICF